jgi:predicted ATPase
VLTGERRDVPDRLRTMRQAIAWSYDLLDRDERALFRKLSVFAGGIALDAVDAIGGDEALDLIGRLVDRSLLRRLPDVAGESRFLMLQTLREYGLEELMKEGEETGARNAHAAWIEELTAKADALLTSDS